MAAEGGSDVPLWWIVVFLALTIGGGYLTIAALGGL